MIDPQAIEVSGVEYCTAHGGIMVEGATDDDRCQYQEIESDAECRWIPLFYIPETVTI
jgi:hypothetical protein